MSPYTLSTLADAVRGPKPARLAVIGHPVAHSASPRMHQPALDEAGIDARYITLEVEPGMVADAFARLRDLGFLGCNVTVPHKFDALAACDAPDDIARDLGAVNTVRFDENGTFGTNTDGYGFEQAVKEGLDLELPGLSVLIVGAGGGAGGALAAHCSRRGVSRLILANRTESKAEALVRALRQRYPKLDVASIGTGDEALLTGLTAACTLLVNTTSLGLREDDPSPLPRGCLQEKHAVLDSIYGNHRTPLLAAADASRARGIDGRLMLLHQGVKAFTTWFPGTDPEAAMRRGLG